MYSCPKCRSELKRVTSNGVTYEECRSCGYCHNTATGETMHIRYDGDSYTVRCPHCANNIRVGNNGTESKDHIGSEITCPNCHGHFSIPGEPDPVLYMEITCSHCFTKCRVQFVEGDLSVLCPQCMNELIRYIGAIPQNGAPSQPARSAAGTQSPAVNNRPVHNAGAMPQKGVSTQPARSTVDTKTTQAHNQTKVSINECYQCPKCGWTHPNTSALNEITAKHTQCQSCGNSYLVHLTWED